MDQNKNIVNPFISTGYKGPDFFCDRERETNILLENMRNGSSTSLISLRRLGKTGLISHLLRQMPEGWRGIYVDILHTENINQFFNSITSSVIQAIPEKSSIGKKFWKIIKSFRPIISFDPLTGATQASFDLKDSETLKGIEAVLLFLDNQEFKVLIAIDEFQQILNYPEKNTNAWLRSKIQLLNNVVFIFSGSHQHLMQKLFTSPKRPFYRSTSLLKLEKIEKEKYLEFIVRMFSLYKKEISEQTANEILDWVDLHTYYVQQLCNRVFSATKKTVTDVIWKTQAFEILKEQESIFFAYRNMLTKHQWQMLKAIASNGRVYKPTSKEFIGKYGLGSSASILRSINSLLNYELIYIEFDNNGEKFYSVYDIFFKKWVVNE
ncbi:MAG: ATP-binding protein [Bacteroidales bacterium]|nr:ATP-binding protein [Bacteroidales bacterium]